MSFPNALVTAGVKSGSINSTKVTFGQRKLISISSKDPIAHGTIVMIVSKMVSLLLRVMLFLVPKWVLLLEIKGSNLAVAATK
jgi:hypothetical protein